MLQIAADILGSLWVRISGPWGKKASIKIFEFLFWLETSKNEHYRGGEVVGALVLKSMYPFISQKCPFIPRIDALFSRIAILFPGIDLLFSRSVFLFLKNALLFFRITHSFSRSVFFLFTVCFFFQECFFSSWLYLVFVLLRAAQIDISLALVLFPLGTIYWPTYDALHLACVHISSNKKASVPGDINVFLTFLCK